MAVRVLQVLAEDTVGGTELHVATLAERLPAGVRCEVATFFAPGPVAAQLKPAGVAVFSLDGPWHARARRLGGLIRAHRFDVVEAYGIKASLVARVACRAASPTPAFVCGVQGLHITEDVDEHALKGRVAVALERATTRLVDRYDANSQGAIELLAAAGIARSRMEYIPNGVDTDRWRPGPTPLRAREPVVVCVARLVDRKRQSDLIEAVAALRREGRAVQLRLLGDGPRRADLEQQARRLGLGDAVVFTGALGADRVREQLAQAVVFALPSLSEGMPAAVLEGMAAGLAIVASDVNGIRDVVEHTVTGLLHEPRDVATLTAQLGSVLEDRDAAERFGAAARARVASHYSLEAMLAAKFALYCRIAGR